MTTQLFCVGTVTLNVGVHRGTNTAKLDGTTSGWSVFGLGTVRGNGVTAANAASVAGPTNGIEFPFNGFPMEFVTLPLAADITIAGTITVNIWAFESTMNDNIAVSAIIDRLDDEGNIVSTIANLVRSTEVALSTSAVNNFTMTPTSTNMLKGERIRVRLYMDDAGVMAVGTGTLRFNSTTGGVDGDTFVTFTENLTFQSTAPTGSILYLTDTAGPAVSAVVEKEMWTARGGAAVNAVTTAITGWTAPIQCTATAGGSQLEWYSRSLNAFTLDGLVHCNLRAFLTSATGSIRAELAVCDSDGANAVVWASYCVAEVAAGALTGTQTAQTCKLAGQPRSVAGGQRLRLRVSIDDTSTIPMFPGTITLAYNGPTAAAAGDSWIQLPQTVTEFVAPPAMTQQAYQFYAEGTESAATALAAQDTPTIGPMAGDLPLQLRTMFQNSSGQSQTSSTWKLQYEKNSSGTWVDVTTSSVGVRAYDSPNLTDGAGAPTNRLTGGVGTFWTGPVSETGSYANYTMSSTTTFTEFLWSIVLRSADLANNDVLKFRVLRNDSTIALTYGITPQITAKIVANITATISTSWGTWTATGTATRDTAASITTSWGTWATTVTGVRTTAATVTTSWGTWTATGVGAPDRAATVTSTWGNWTATALASAIEHPATATTSWGTWVSTVTGVRTTAATVTTTWGTWTGTATAVRETAATATTTWGTWTATATGTVAKNVPQNVVATPTGKTTISVTWTTLAGATAYDIERDGLVIVSDHPASPYNDTGLTPNTLYSYRVRAVL